MDKMKNKIKQAVSKRTTIRELEAMSIASCAVVIFATYLLAGKTDAKELNPIAAVMIDSFDWRLVAGVKIASAAAVFMTLAYVHRKGIPGLSDRHSRTFSTGFGVLATTVFVANAINDILVVFQVGLPDSVYLSEFASLLLIVTTISTAVFFRPVPKTTIYRTMNKFEERLSPDQDLRKLAAAICVVIVVSATIGPFAGLSPVGSAEASSGQIYDDFEDGTIFDSWSASSTDSSYWEITTTEPLEGSKSLYFNAGSYNEMISYSLSDPQTLSMRFNVDQIASTGDQDITFDTYSPSGKVGEIMVIDGAVGYYDGGYQTFAQINANTDYTLIADYSGSTYSVEVYNLETAELVGSASGLPKTNNDGIDEFRINVGTQGYTATFDRLATDDSVAPPTVNVTGNVKSAFGDSLSNADISATNSTGAQIDTTTTDSNGDYTLSLPDGDYTVTAEKSGYVSDSQSVSVSGSAISGVDFSLAENAVGGVVRDQNGNPVANATVEVIGVDYANLSTEVGQTNVSRADEILDQDTRAIPDEYDADLQISGQDGFGANAACEYVAINTPGEWGVERWSTGVDVGSPTVNPGAEQEIVFSAWDPNSAGSLEFRDDADSDLPGKTVARTIEIERLDPAGDSLESNTIELDERRQVGIGPTAKKHAIGTETLPTGVYEVNVEGCEQASYPILVGDEGDVRSLFQTELENQRGELSESAQKVSDRINQSVYVRYTTTTDANGQFSQQITNPTVERVAVSAYRVDGKMLTDLSSPTPQDMRHEIAKQNYNGSVAFSLSPERYDVPSSNAVIRVRKFSSPPYTSLDSFANRWAAFRDAVENESLTGTGDFYSVPVSEWDDEQLQDGAENLSKIIDSNNEDLIDEWEERRGEEWEDVREQIEDSERTNAELQDDIRAMEETISSLRNTLDAEDPEIGTTPGDGTTPTEIDYRQAFDGDFDRDDITATWKDFDGSSTPISSEHLSVNERPGRGDEVVVEDYPIPNGSAGGYVSVLVVDEDGNLGEGGERVENPTFEGEIPGLRSIDMSSIRPGPNEEVSVTPRFEEGGVSVSNVDVYDDQGNTVATSVSGGTATFTPKSAGSHFVRINYTAADGSGPFVESYRLAVGNTSYDYPPSVYVSEGRSGVFTIAGDEVKDADTTLEDGGSSISVTALVGEGSGANEVHYYLSDAPNTPSQDITTRVIAGDSIATGTSLSRRVGVYVHGRDIAEGATIYRSGDNSQGRLAIPVDGESKGGVVSAGNNGGTVIKSYTSKAGKTTIEIDNSPGRFDSLRYRFDLWLSNRSLPFAFVSSNDQAVGKITATVDELVDDVVAGFGGIA